jgi:hypothetical protein
VSAARVYRERNAVLLASKELHRRAEMAERPVMAMSPLFGIELETDPPAETEELVAAGPAAAAALTGDRQLEHRVAGMAELGERLRTLDHWTYQSLIYSRTQRALAVLDS